MAVAPVEDQPEVLALAFSDPNMIVDYSSFASSVIRRGQSFSVSTGQPPSSLGETFSSTNSSSWHSKCSSSCSFDSRIWEEFHLHENSSSGSELQQALILESAESLHRNTTEENVDAQNVCTVEIAHPSFVLPGKFFLYSAFDHQQKCINPSHFDRVDEIEDSAIAGARGSLPVLQIIQTGSMTFTNEEERLEMPSNTNTAVRKTEACKGMIHTQMSNLRKKKAASDTKTFKILTEANVGSEHEETEVEEAGIRLNVLFSARFLVQETEEMYSASIAPIRAAGCVPFKWEEAPGIPKPCTDLARYMTPFPSLQLPPRLQYRSESPAPCARNQFSHLGSPRPALHCPSPRVQVELPKSGHPNLCSKSLFSSSLQYFTHNAGGQFKASHSKRVEDPLSPTRTFYGPETGRFSTSSASSMVEGISVSSSPGSSEFHSHPNALDGGTMHADQRPSHFPSKETAVLNSFPGLNSRSKRGGVIGLRWRVMKSVKNMFHRWRTGGKRQPQKCHRERKTQKADIWAPTLATSLRSMTFEGETSVSAQLLLDKLSMGENRVLEQSSSPKALCSSCRKEAKSIIRKQSMDVELADISTGRVTNHRVLCYPFCSPSTRPRAPQKGRKSNRRRRTWILRKIRSSSSSLAAIWRAMKRSLGNGICRRRRPIYENLER